MVGLGYMTFPRLCDLVGLVSVLLVVILTGLASLFGSFMILRAYEAKPVDTYSLLVRSVLGPRHYLVMTVFLAVLISFGITLSIYFGRIIRHCADRGGREEERLGVDCRQQQPGEGRLRANRLRVLHVQAAEHRLV
jgi:amino acid permease